MTTNTYFIDHHNSVADQKLAEDLIVEAIQIYGRDMYYSPREYVALDRLYGEDKLSAFTQAYLIEFYINSFQQFGGDREFIGKLGIEMRDEIDLEVSVVRFKTEVTDVNPSIVRPREGDLILFPMDNSLFEITFVEDKNVFYQMGKLFTFGLRCKRYEVGGESLATGVDGIDDHMGLQYTRDLTLVSGTGNFTPGETAFQGMTLATATFKGTVVVWQSPLLVVHRVVGDLDESLNIVGATSGAVWDVGSELPSNNSLVRNDNQELEQEKPFVVDITESNSYSGW